MSQRTSASTSTPPRTQALINVHTRATNRRPVSLPLESYLIGVDPALVDLRSIKQTIDSLDGTDLHEWNRNFFMNAILPWETGVAAIPLVREKGVPPAPGAIASLMYKSRIVGRHDVAMALFDHSCQQPTRGPTNAVYGQAMLTCLDAGWYRDVFNIFDSYKESAQTNPDKVQIDVQVYEHVLKACHKLPDAHRAVQYLQEMKRSDLQPNKICYHRIFDAFAWSARFNEIMPLLESECSAGNARYEPPVYEAAMSALKNALPDEVEKVYETMRRHGVLPRYATLRHRVGAAMHSYNKSSSVPIALARLTKVAEVLKEGRDMGIFSREFGYRKEADGMSVLDLHANTVLTPEAAEREKGRGVSADVAEAIFRCLVEIPQELLPPAPGESAPHGVDDMTLFITGMGDSLRQHVRTLVHKQGWDPVLALGPDGDVNQGRWVSRKRWLQDVKKILLRRVGDALHSYRVSPSVPIALARLTKVAEVLKEGRDMGIFSREFGYRKEADGRSVLDLHANTVLTPEAAERERAGGVSADIAEAIFRCLVEIPQELLPPAPGESAPRGVDDKTSFITGTDDDSLRERVRALMDDMGWDPVLDHGSDGNVNPGAWVSQQRWLQDVMEFED